MPMTLGDFVAAARSRITEVTAEEVDLLLEENEEILLIDVREPEEYAAGHIPGALLIPRGTLEAAADPHNKKRVDALCEARDCMIILYCESGGRSALATDTLQYMGFSQVRNLAGGCVLWEAEGLPLIKGEPT